MINKLCVFFFCLEVDIRGVHGETGVKWKDVYAAVSQRVEWVSSIAWNVDWDNRGERELPDKN